MIMNRKLFPLNETRYESCDGFVMQREYGISPNGNQINGFWVLRDKFGTWIGFDQYRYNLAELHSFELET